MNYQSTRNANLSLTASQAILQGISEEGGLFVPKGTLPQLDMSSLVGLDYPNLAAEVLGSLLTDYSKDFLLKAAGECYGDNFDGVAKTVKVTQGLYSLELWHGPTCAFKDYALQLMPRLLVESKRINHDDSETLILVATSGDTGKAALEGYKNLPGIKIGVFYPNNGTSETQRLQMATQDGDNVRVWAVNGNFDDAQTGVKKVFVDKEFASLLGKKNYHLTSANSINWGRLAPQIVYYFASYLDLVAKNEIKMGDKLDFCVPTGNFGDILAGWYAKQMGLPVGKLYCASNQNNVLTDFGKTGVYDAAREFYKTTSPSMDILVSSNLERLLYHKSQDAAIVSELMDKLMKQDKKYEVSAELKKSIDEDFGFGFADEKACFARLAEVFHSFDYLCDPHTAVAFDVAMRREEKTPCVVLSTADPYKFSAAALCALGGDVSADDFANMAVLEALTGTKAPAQLKSLSEKQVRFTDIINPEDIKKVAQEM